MDLRGQTERFLLSRGDVSRVKRNRFAVIKAAARAECVRMDEFGWYRRIEVSCPMLSRGQVFLCPGRVLKTPFDKMPHKK